MRQQGTVYVDVDCGWLVPAVGGEECFHDNAHLQLCTLVENWSVVLIWGKKISLSFFAMF